MDTDVQIARDKVESQRQLAAMAGIDPPPTAAVIAAYYDDGQCFYDEDDVEISDFCRYQPGVEVSKPENPTSQTLMDTERFIFADGSVITIVGDGWDLGYKDCYCWQGAGHRDECAGYGLVIG